ncbi:7,8-didemethyl-8-hydroxy-5-deazariboflavin synthase CofG [Antiquaquibacter oligotrophicus]|uniref:7,8-didemethyl-8-hydroxy-5-deazariboflavin synthase CofG n=1 Tax=Antiquaquibacter oligotrophicus TaxID=2880260 RepID=UPI002AC8E516|nr:7,8-didemethyl-8-hydroxy-5-deazariboflavin synthase CofG [Antiquaquibacter oligotrophicus]UDF14453.1 7,8-didemethyl-8-hydroxy-5-deazariboflavin synthase CofG [Antiquaquibacter oligotrophicus]
MTLVDASPRSSVEEILERVRAGGRASVDDAEVLLDARGDDLERLLHLAAHLRDEGLARAGRPGVITYSRKVFLPVTTLCRDRCHYCIFVDTPGQLLKLGKPAYMSREQVLAVAREGAALGCKEALFTLGDRPEERWPEARAWLDEHGYESTLHYVADMAQAVLDETGLLPHLNPGVMTAAELEFLRPYAPSMGMMLETTSTRLYTEKGQVHYGSPDKDPAVRLAVIEDAGAARVPFTTGILVGIGETVRDRAESLVALRDADDRHGHIQEVIVQNFRAKPQTAMQAVPDAELLEYVAAIAVARIVMGADARIQVPPNLSDAGEFELLLRAGADDWGGVSPLTADHVNPERPWPHLDDLAEATARYGFELRERLTAHPEYLNEQWMDAGIAPRVTAMADDRGLAADDACGLRSGRSPRLETPQENNVGAVSRRDLRSLLNRQLSSNEYDELVAEADALRRYTVGEAVSIVVNRNLDSTRYSEYGPDGAAAVAREAWELGATELCVQGLMPGGEYLELARAVKSAAPGIHLHAFRPADIDDFATRNNLSLDAALSQLRDAGVDTIPGTGLKLLDEDVRARMFPADLPVERWVEVITAAHRAGFRTSSVMFYGHGETWEQRIAHLERLIEIQSATGGFTEFVPIPLPGSTVSIEEHRAVHAISRILLNGHIRHIQVPWTRLGVDASALMLQSGADDLGGTLLDGTVLPEFAAEFGQELTLDQAKRLTAKLFRPLRQRTTTYGEPGARS